MRPAKSAYRTADAARKSRWRRHVDLQHPPVLDAADPNAVARTNTAHIASTSGATQFQLQRHGGFESRPSGNAVSLEDEMMKVANNQMDYQAATSLYSRGLGLLRTAIGRRS